MIFRTGTSEYEAKLENGKITLEKTAILPGKTSGVQPGEKKEGECLVITPKGVFLYKENFIPEGNIFNRGLVKQGEKNFSPEIETSPPREI